ncbi:zinc ABC transporter substrate-binding protein ZnuA [Allorhizobium terrae]|uniref:High-affinity zinc uptake system protein ZnuA n=1 Tax=Allorhizobium terrae TaxID=1848972 RepID=A0A4S4A7Y1_9HYPH|nr:zinc ABC transporter substrate-binding protein ZnuA [Allorhizobium terrae]THF54086.1 zinc ABC transporter substrate-binding protein ZnuA [Allorhizobium terrae]
MRAKHLAYLGFMSSFLACGSAFASPNVVTSIKPLNSIVAAIMQGAGTPELLVEGAGSPHNYSLKPSKAEALQHADVVFWIGPGLEAFLDKPLDALAGKAKVVEMEHAKGVKLLPTRQGGTFEPHMHDEDHDAAEGGEHHDADHAHDEHAHDAQAHDEQAHDEHHEHDEAFDMHIWLDPNNAKAMAKTVADTLSQQDAANAALYAKNLAAFDASVDALDKKLAAQLAPVRGKPFIVFHDGYQYFEHHYKITVAGSITVSPETAPGAKRVAEIHAKVKELGATCVFAEPQFTPKLISVVAEGTKARTGVLDPLGTDLKDGPDLYPALMTNMANAISTCLKG